MSEPIGVRDAYRGRHVLLTGGSGFVGKVWLIQALTHLPDIGRIYVLLRPKALVPARSRFEKMINNSPAFGPLHEAHGARFADYLRDRVEVVEGDTSEPDLGMAPDVAARLARDLDLVVHCAGLVDFNPDLRKALSSNVDSAVHVADFLERADHAALLHISTCYVAGDRYGEVREELHDNYAPNGEPFDAEREVAEAREAAERICAQHESSAHVEEIRMEVEALVQARRSDRSAKLVKNLTRRRVREGLKQALSDEGMRRARRWGWPNTYTYTKSMAESVLARRNGKLRVAVLRPTIVETALAEPFAGWNESFNGSAPLAYLMGTWFRFVPAKPDAPFDVIPVDLVCRAMSIAGAALLTGRHSSVYQIGTTDRNRCSVGRAAELIVLAHRRHYRGRGRTRSERVWKSRWDAILVEPDHLLNVENLRSVVQGAAGTLDMLPRRLREKAERTIERTERTDKKLHQIEQMVELYMPFMYENFHAFVCRAIEAHPALEPEFAFDPRVIDWRRYWIETHMPGLRRWTFPLIEGKKPERHRPAHPVSLSEPPPARVQPREQAQADSTHSRAHSHEAGE